MHLLALLAYLPTEVQPSLALPAAPPDWLRDVGTSIHASPDTPFNRLKWEQHTLPRMAQELDARLIHFTSPVAPLFGRTLSVISPAGFDLFLPIQDQSLARQSTQFSQRLRESMARGGQSRAHCIFWPSDLPKPASLTPLWRLPPIVHPAFYPGPGGENGIGPTGSKFPNNVLLALDIPETYTLYHGPSNNEALHRLL